MATLLPLAVTQFLDQNGVPLASGSVFMYVPGTTTPKQCWGDAAATILLSNPIILNSSGEAVIYGSGSYRQIVNDAAGNPIWDQLTADTAVGGLAWGGTSTGTPNAQIIAASSFSQQDGQTVSFIVGVGLTNTGATTVTLGVGGTPISVLKDTSTGPTSLTGGELVAGNVASLTYDATRGAFHLTDQPVSAVPTGSIAQFIMSAIPSGYLLANGAAVSRSTYAALNQLASAAGYGAPWGSGNGTTTFNIPDLRGLFGRAWDDGAGVDPGRAIGTTQADAYLNHLHTLTDPGHAHLLTPSLPIWSSGGGAVEIVTQVSSNAQIGAITIQPSFTGITVNTSTTGGTETRPKNIALAYAIKT